MDKIEDIRVEIEEENSECLKCLGECLLLGITIIMLPIVALVGAGFKLICFCR